MTEASNSQDNLNDRISIPELADDISCPKQTLFKIASRLQITLVKQRDPDRGNQLVSTVSKSDADRLRLEYTTRTKSVSSDDDFETLDDGVFYLIQLEPELDPGRFKLGFTTDMPSRLRKHKCAAPFATSIKTWPCRRIWERTAIDCITSGVEQLHTEVFRCSSIDDVVSKANQFFSLMPQLIPNIDEAEAE